MSGCAVAIPFAAVSTTSSTARARERIGAGAILTGLWARMESTGRTQQTRFLQPSIIEAIPGRLSGFELQRRHTLGRLDRRLLGAKSVDLPPVLAPQDRAGRIDEPAAWGEQRPERAQ